MQVRELEVPTLNKKWQFQLREMWYNQDIFNARSVVWVFGKSRRSERSLFALYMMLTKPNDVLYINYLCRMSDYHMAAINGVNKGWNGNAVICNLPRENEDKNISEPLESCKEGRVIGSKYGVVFCLERPITLVFASFPKVDETSVDRWRIYEIINEELIYRDWKYFSA